MTKEYRHSLWRRGLNGLVRPLARLGLTGPRTYLLTVPGRVSGRPWSTPVSIVTEGDERWLVAPSGERNWVRNARAATTVELRRGRHRQRYRVEELDPADAVPVLRRYFALGRVTRPFFDVSLDSTEEEWRAEAPRHPVFKLSAAVVASFGRARRRRSAAGCRTSRAATTFDPSVRASSVIAMRVRNGRALRRRASRRQMLGSSTGGLAGDGAAATTWGSTMTVFMALMKHAVAVALL